MRLVKDRVVEHPHRYKLTKVAGTEDVYDLEQVPGTVTDAGTSVNRQLFNSIDSALLCTHSKTGTVHTFTLNSNVAAFVPGQTIYTVKAALTASIEYGDTFTLTDGTTSYTGIVPKTSEGGNYRVTLYQELSPVVIFEVNLGGSAKHAFFRGGGQKRLFREVFAASGVWTCPDFVDEVYVMAFGGGGGGGSGLYNAPGGGGSGGNMVESLLSVTPGAKYTVTIGAGGAGGTISGSTFSAGGNGGATMFGNLLTATGGTGGPAKDNTGGGSQFAAASGSTGADGYGLSAPGGRPGNVQINASVTPVVSVGGGGGGASYGKGGDGGTLLPTGTDTGSVTTTFTWSVLNAYFASSMAGEYGGGGGGGVGYNAEGKGGKGGDGILFISYYADPSMLSDRTPEEFDIQSDAVAATVAETSETEVATEETTAETTLAADEAAETEENP